MALFDDNPKSDNDNVVAQLFPLSAVCLLIINYTKIPAVH